MYLLGFIFLFIGLSLFLYTILKFIYYKNQISSNHNQQTQKEQKKENIINNVHVHNLDIDKEESSYIREDSISKTIPEKATINHKTSIKNKNNLENNTQLVRNQAEIKKENFSKDDSKNHKYSKVNTKDNAYLESNSIVKNLYIYIVGYLYYDPTRTTHILLKKFDSISGEYLSNIIRLGNATLEWENDQFIINYDVNKIYLNFKDLSEIRFLDDCAVFISHNTNIPYYYFFSSTISELKKFLNILSSSK